MRMRSLIEQNEYQRRGKVNRYRRIHLSTDSYLHLQGQSNKLRRTQGYSRCYSGSQFELRKEGTNKNEEPVPNPV